MTNLIKIGAWFINLNNVRSVQDLTYAVRKNQLKISFSDNPDESITLVDQEADNLRTWLNSVANDLTHLHVNTEP